MGTAYELGARSTSAQAVSLARPTVPIVAYSPNKKTLRKMALYWGVLGRELPQMRDIDSLVDFATADLMSQGLCSPGERIVIVYGAPIGVSGSTNSIRVHVVG